MEHTKPNGTARPPWMQVDLDLPTKPETQRICDLADCDIDQAVGRLVLFWCWLDRHADSELLAGLTFRSLVRIAQGNEAFWRAVATVGWLVETDHGLVVPGFDRRFSASAKQRLLASKRQERARLSQPCHADVTPERDAGVTESLPRGRGRVRERERDIRSSTSTSDVGDQKCAEEKQVDWDEAVRDANGAIRKLGRGATKPADRSLLIKAAALKQRLSEDWFWDAIDGAVQIKPSNVFAYLQGIWRTKCQELKRPIPFNALLKSVEVPEEILQPKAPVHA